MNGVPVLYLCALLLPENRGAGGIRWLVRFSLSSIIGMNRVKRELRIGRVCLPVQPIQCWFKAGEATARTGPG